MATDTGTVTGPVTFVDRRQNAGSGGLPILTAAKVVGQNGPSGATVMTVRVDCGAKPADAGEVARVADIPADFVATGQVIVQTPEGGGLDIDVGLAYCDGTVISHTSMCNGLNGNIADLRQGLIGTEAKGVDRCIILTFNDAASVAVLDVVLGLVNFQAGKGGETDARWQNV